MDAEKQSGRSAGGPPRKSWWRGGGGAAVAIGAGGSGGRAGAHANRAVASVPPAGGIVASAAVPTFPNNITVFPNRDFVSVEGYQDHVGQTATLTVPRGAQTIGAAARGV